MTLDDHIIICHPAPTSSYCKHWRIRDANGCVLDDFPEASECYMKDLMRGYADRGIPCDLSYLGDDSVWHVTQVNRIPGFGDARVIRWFPAHTS